MNTFTTGNTYSAKSACDSGASFTFTVESRTQKTLKLSNGKSYRIKSNDEGEFVKPMGNYSMAPTLRA